MEIGKRWKIESGHLNVILFKKRSRTNKRTDQTYDDWEIKGYFATIANALHELVNQGVRDTELKDLKDISTQIDNLHHIIQCLPRSARAMTGASKV